MSLPIPLMHQRSIEPSSLDALDHEAAMLGSEEGRKGQLLFPALCCALSSPVCNMPLFGAWHRLCLLHGTLAFPHHCNGHCHSTYERSLSPVVLCCAVQLTPTLRTPLQQQQPQQPAS
jgi:hypothetical protein